MRCALFQIMQFLLILSTQAFYRKGKKMNTPRNGYVLPMILVLVAGFCFAAGAATHVSTDLKEMPGYVEFDSKHLLGEVTPKVSLMLDPSML